MPIILGLIVKIGRRSYASYIGVYFIVTGDSRYYVYADNPSRILISGHYLRIYI